MPNPSHNFARPPVAPSRLMGTDGTWWSVSSAALISGVAQAFYIGRTMEHRSSLTLGFYQHGANAVGAGWSEIALATGTFSTLAAASVDLTALGYASVDTEAKAAATAVRYKTLTGLALQPDDDLWVIVASAYATTQMTLRVAGGDGDRPGTRRSRAAYQPSLNIGVARTFTFSAGENCPIIFGHRA
jgi:hypothetical protein